MQTQQAEHLTLHRRAQQGREIHFFPLVFILSCPPATHTRTKKLFSDKNRT